MNFKLGSLLLLMGMFLFSSCSKEKIDKTDIDEPDVDSIISICDFDVSLENRGGSLYARTIGGTAPFTYNWSTGEEGHWPRIPGISNGEYDVTVTDAEGCTVSKSITVTCNSLGVSFSFDDTQAGEIVKAYVSGGTAPFTYLWSNGETTQEIPVPLDGEISVTITDGEDCNVSRSLTLPCNFLRVSFDVTGTPAEGIITPNVSGGVAPFSYLWSTGETSPAILVLSMDDLFSVTITDSEGCIAENKIRINHCSTLKATIAEQPPGSGTLWAAPAGGTAPYHYRWSTGATTDNITTINATGPFSVTVTDANRCWRVDSFDF